MNSVVTMLFIFYVARHQAVEGPVHDGHPVDAAGEEPGALVHVHPHYGDKLSIDLHNASFTSYFKV